MSPSRRISRPALLTTGVMHLALLWLVLQSPPVVHKLRAVVQYLAPITLRTEAPVKPITQPLPKPELKTVQEIKASVPAPPVIRTQAIEPPPAPIVKSWHMGVAISYRSTIGSRRYRFPSGGE